MELAQEPKQEEQKPARPVSRHTRPLSSTPVRDFWPRYRSRIFFLNLIMQLLITSAVLGALYFSGIDLPVVLASIIAMAIFIATTVLNFILLSLALTPLRELSAAVTHISGEPTITTPPNPNAPRFERDGLAPVLKTLYSLASGMPESSTVNTPISRQVSLKTLTLGLDETRTGVVLLDRNHQIIYANHAAPTRVGENERKELELIFDDPKDTIAAWLTESEKTRLRATKTWHRIPNRLIGEEDRRIFDISVNYEKGSDAEVVLIFHDLTAAYQPEDDDLDFIAFAAHELRGPITVIRGYLDVLSDELQPEMDDEQKELLQRLVVSANRLSGYVNNILNASRYDRRHLQVHLVEERLSDIYATIADDMNQRAAAQNRLLSVAFPNDLPSIAADRSSLSEVIGNLIDNAIKYSNEGGAVNVSARADGPFVIIRIEDHGIGMPGNVVANLFHKFYRSHRSRETVAGTGIGLYISKAIIESHGGSIGVKSVEGEGSVFECSIPTFASIKDKLHETHGENATLISTGGGWIKNHSMYRG